MHKQIYLVVTDLHFSYKNKDSRFNYIAEINFVMDKIMTLIEEYIEEGYEVYLLFLGDIIDNSFKDMQRAIVFNNYFVYFKQICKRIYSVIGNHEMSYYKDNPFWSLMSRIDSDKVKSVLTRSWQPQGLLQLIEIPDTLEVGDTVIHFNHHATPVSTPVEGKINIGLFHKDIVSKAIVADMTQNLGLDIFESNPSYIESSPVISGYDYCFMGHLHKVYGHWQYENEKTGKTTDLRYLASLGRPNHSEVQDNFLERNIPGIVFEDDKFKEIVDNKFNLYSRGETVKEDVIEYKQAKYQEVKTRRELKNYVAFNDDPIENIKTVFSDNYEMLALFESCLKTNVSEREIDVQNKVFDILNS
ncbi:metallophosphoesterase [Paraclostridium bifermentans]|uniref:metallophosphoesterase n=1 Tax=Paraclostridium bifermentans TaxID=1490 RepID=UPI00374FBD0B